MVLSCGVTGMPTPSVSWFREGIEINQTSVLADGTLSIRVTESEASREGTNYYCVATNRIGSGNSIALRSRNVSVSHICECHGTCAYVCTYYVYLTVHFCNNSAVLGGFQNTDIGTVVNGAVALECDCNPNIPTPNVTWFANDMVVEEMITDNRILFLEGGRYLYIRILTAAQRIMRYHCVVDNNGMPVRAPTTYTLTADIPTNNITVYKELGTMAGGVGEPARFVYAAAARDAAGNMIQFAITCPRNDPNVIFLVTESIITAILQESARNEDQVTFTCQVLGLNIDINGTINVSGTC